MSGTEQSHFVLNLTRNEANELRHLLAITDSASLSASESGTKQKIELELEKQGIGFKQEPEMSHNDGGQDE